MDARNYDFVFAGPQLGAFLTSPFRRVAAPKKSWTGPVEGPTDLQRHALAYRIYTAHLSRSLNRILVKRFDSRGEGRACQIARSETALLDQPQLDGGFVYWSRTTSETTGTVWTIHRRRLPTRACRSRGSEQVATHRFQPSVRGGLEAIPMSFAVDRGRLFYGVLVTPPAYGATIPDVSEIWELQPFSFEDR